MTKVVLGGGISGLSAAYYLSKLANTQNILLLESSNRLGGWLKSEKVDSEVIFEQASRTIRPGGAAGINTLNLVEELGLEPSIKPVSRLSPAARNRLIYANGQLHLLPNSLPSLFQTIKPFSQPLFTQIIHDLTAPVKISQDESAYEFAKRRFGPEVADYIIDTILCGICAGSSKEVSVNFLMKRMFSYEQNHGSVIKGFLMNLFSKRETLPALGALAQRAKRQKWSVYSFKDGIEMFPKALETYLRNSKSSNIILNAKCKEISFSDFASIQMQDGTKYDSSHVLSSIPAKNLAQLVQNQHPALATKLNNIKTVSVGVVNLLYDGLLIKNPAFGFLVPPKEKLPILGVIYDSCSRLNDTNQTVLTVMMGGHWFKQLLGDDPSQEKVLDIAQSHVAKILGISAHPLKYKVNILRDCIPQYVVGHQQNLEEINSYIRDKKLPISLCGASYHGVGVNDVILSARNAVEELAAK